MNDGTEHNNLQATEELAIKMLKNTLEIHRSKGHRVTEQSVELEPRPQYKVVDQDGQLIATYQIID